tara:strand:- start:4051 stop:4803 length:753 start_codon:yes stop_codon:yes gene_type:complete
MTKITVNRKDFLSFLSGFSKGLTDLRLDCAGSRITIEIGYASFYLRKYFLTAQIQEEGVIHIADMDKVFKFFKASNTDDIVMKQTASIKPLHVESGGNKLQLPSTDDIESASKTATIRALLMESQQKGWAFFGKTSMSVHATTQTKDLISLSGMRSVVSDDTDFKLRVHCGEEEMGIVAGKAVSGKLFTTLPISDTDGPATTVESLFSIALPKCLQYLDDGEARVHMGKSSPVIFEQLNTLLLIIDVGDD